MSNEQTEAVEVEQFDGFSPEGSSPEDSGAADTFDSGMVHELPEQEAKVEEKQEVKADENDPKQTMDTANELEAKEAAKATGDKEEEESPEQKASDADNEGEGEPEKEETPEEPKGKAVRFKNGDNSVDVEEDSTVAVKVNGKKEFVPLKELMSNYSGQQAWDKKFGEFEGEKQKFAEERDSFENQRKEVVTHFTRIGDKITAGLTDPKADPADALRYLVDTAGHDVLQWEQRMMEHYGNLAYQFSEMSEAEQQLFWSERKNQILLDNQANRAKIDEERTAQEQRQQSEIELRKQYGVSDKEFDGAYNELIQLGYEANQLNAKNVCEYIAIKPHAEKAENICKQFKDDLGDDELTGLITNTAQILRDNDYLSPEEAVKLAGRKLGFQIEDVEDDIQKLNEKVAAPANKVEGKSSPQKVGKTKAEDHVESFDDYENDYYNYG